MKKNICSALLFAVTGVSSGAFAADGNVAITGEFFVSTCNIQAESKNMTVSLGNVQRSDLKTAGATSAAVPFTLSFTDCALNSGIQVQFMGTAAASDNTVFVLDNANQVSTAKNVGLQIHDQWDNVKYPNYVGSWTIANNSTMSLAYKAAYIALSDDVEPGDANVLVEYIVTYV
ncbi:fimbrial protein [Chania multitudinisentens]|uniref:fimbrial protein n=1 Tax=Chania multitudinisentens TaxID=1639108 RepID=UPI0003E129C8|nr:fimbrial protein [Chania multitudinisentens]